MLTRHYPKRIQELFTDRVHVLKKLKYNIGQNRHTCIIGLRKIGKSLLIKEFMLRNIKKQNLVYIDLDEYSFVPVLYAKKYLSDVAYWVLTKGEEDKILFEDLNYLLEKLIKNNFKESAKYIARFNSELEKMKIDNRVLLEYALNFPVVIQKDSKKKIVLFIDEFQKNLNLNSYPDIKDFPSLFRSFIQKQSSIVYVVGGSAVRLLEKLFAGNKEPMFLHFELERIKNFTKEDSISLIDKTLPHLSPELKTFVFHITNAHPFYIHLLLQEIKYYEDVMDLKPDKDLIKNIFVLMLTSEEKTLYRHIQYVYEESIKNVRGKNTAYSILQILSKNEGMSLAEIAREMKKRSGDINKIADKLVFVDFLFVENGKYFFTDKLLKLWILYKSYGYNLYSFEDLKANKSVLAILQEKYLRASTELGRAKEYELKYKLGKKFGLKLYNYQKEGVEFDLIGEKSKTRYFFEIKWRNKPADYNELKKFFSKVESSEFKGRKKLFFVSKSGFTDRAKKFARTSKILLLPIP